MPQLTCRFITLSLHLAILLFVLYLYTTKENTKHPCYWANQILLKGLLRHLEKYQANSFINIVLFDSDITMDDLDYYACYMLVTVTIKIEI